MGNICSPNDPPKNGSAVDEGNANGELKVQTTLKDTGPKSNYTSSPEKQTIHMEEENTTAEPPMEITNSVPDKISLKADNVKPIK